MVNEKLKLLPLDKKILKACAILEIKHQTTHVEKFLLEHFFDLSDDSKSVYLALVNRYNDSIPVGNYGGLYVGLHYLYKDLGITKKFIMGKQLERRTEILNDENSSKQWSVKILLGHPRADFKLGNYFVNLADSVRKNWRDHKKIFKMMNKPDDNIKRVMEFYWNQKDFFVTNSEIAVFKAVLDEKETSNLILENPQWKNHETDRTKTIHQSLKQYHNKQMITTDDPRVCMSIAIKAKLDDQKIELKDYNCINKIFPKFWECLT